MPSTSRGRATAGANTIGATREPERPARDVRRHREPLSIARHRVHQRRCRWMKRGAAESADEQHGSQHGQAGGRANRAQDDHGEHRSCHEKHARPPAICQRPKPELRDRTGQLVAHGQDANFLKRQVEPRDEQRQQRREHVPVCIDDEVGRRRGPDRQNEDRTVSTTQPSKRPSTRSRASWNSRTRSSEAAAASTPRPIAIAPATLALAWESSARNDPIQPICAYQAAAPIARPAARILRNVIVSCRPSMPPRWRRNRKTCRAALTMAAMRGAKRQAGVTHDAHERDVDGDVHGDRCDAGGHRNAAQPQRIERRRHDSHHRVRDQPQCVQLQRARGGCSVSRREPARARKSGSRSAPASTIKPSVAGNVEHEHQSDCGPDGVRIVDMSDKAASRDKAGVEAAAIDTPNRPIGRYISRNA